MKVIILIILWLLFFHGLQILCSYEYEELANLKFKYKDFTNKNYSIKQFKLVKFLANNQEYIGLKYAGSFFIFETGLDFDLFLKPNNVVLHCDYYNYGCLGISRIDNKIKIYKQIVGNEQLYLFYLIEDDFRFNTYKSYNKTIVDKYHYKEKYFLALKKEIDNE